MSLVRIVSSLLAIGMAVMAMTVTAAAVAAATPATARPVSLPDADSSAGCG